MLPEIAACGARVYGVSPDTVALQDEFIKKEALGFPLLADVEGSVITAFDVWKEHPTFGKVVNRFVLPPSFILIFLPPSAFCATFCATLCATRSAVSLTDSL